MPAQSLIICNVIISEGGPFNFIAFLSAGSWNIVSVCAFEVNAYVFRSTLGRPCSTFVFFMRINGKIVNTQSKSGINESKNYDYYTFSAYVVAYGRSPLGNFHRDIRSKCEYITKYDLISF